MASPAASGDGREGARLGTSRRNRNGRHDARRRLASGPSLLRLSARRGAPLLRALGRACEQRTGWWQRLFAARPAVERDRPGAGGRIRRRKGGPAAGRHGRSSSRRVRPQRDRAAAGTRHRDRVRVRRHRRHGNHGGYGRRYGRRRDGGRCRRAGAGGTDAAAGCHRPARAPDRTRRRRLGSHRSAGAGREAAAPQAADRRGRARTAAVVRPDDLAAPVDDDRHRRRARQARGRRFPGGRAAERAARADHQPLPQGEGAVEHPRRRRHDERVRGVVGVVSRRAGARLPGHQSTGVRIAAAARRRQAVARGDRVAFRLPPAARFALEDRRRSVRPGHPVGPAPRRRGARRGAARGPEGTGRGGSGGEESRAGPGGAGDLHLGRKRQLRPRRGRSRGASRRSHRGLLRGDRHDGASLPALHAAAHGALPRGRFRPLPGRRHRLLRLPGPAARHDPRRSRPAHDRPRRVGPWVPLGGRPAAGCAAVHDRAAGGVARPRGDLPPERPRGAARRPAERASNPLRHRSNHPRSRRSPRFRRDAGAGDRRSDRPGLPGAAPGAAHPVVRDDRDAAAPGSFRVRRPGGPRGRGGAAREPPVARLHRRRRRKERCGGRRRGCGRDGWRGRSRRGGGVRRHAGLLSPQPGDLFPEAARLRAGDRGAAPRERAAAAAEDR